MMRLEKVRAGKETEKLSVSGQTIERERHRIEMQRTVVAANTHVHLQEHKHTIQYTNTKIRL